MPQPHLYWFPAPPKVLSTPPVNDQLLTPAILLGWYLVKVPLHPELNNLQSMQAVFAPDHLQLTLQVNDQCRGYSILAQSRDLIIANVQRLESPASPAKFFCTSEGALQSTVD